MSDVGVACGVCGRPSVYFETCENQGGVAGHITATASECANCGERHVIGPCPDCRDTGGEAVSDAWREHDHNSVEPDFRVDSALTLLVQASRVSPPLREAVATVENEVRRLTEELAHQATCHQNYVATLDAAIEAWRVRAESAEAALAELRHDVRATVLTLGGEQCGLHEPYPDNPRWTPFTRWLETLARRAAASPEET